MLPPSAPNRLIASCTMRIGPSTLMPVSLLIVLSFLRADVPQVMRGVNSCLASGPSC
jgi:hypothetical protein